MRTSGAVTRPESIWNAISAPTESVPSKTDFAPNQITATNIAFSRKLLSVRAVMEIFATRK